MSLERSLQDSPFPPLISIRPYFYSPLLLYPAKALSPAHPFPAPYYYSPLLMYLPDAISLSLSLSLYPTQPFPAAYYVPRRLSLSLSL